MKEPEIKKEKEIYEGSFLSLNLFEMEKDGERFEREVVIFPKTVGILPLIEESRIVLIRQYRCPARQYLWEIPAGKIEEGEDPEQAAKRELIEETGFGVKSLQKLGEIYVSPGYTTEYMYLFKAGIKRQGEQQLEKGEIISRIDFFEEEEVWKMVDQGGIKDSKTLMALALNKLDYKFQAK
ncbi:MAG: NUDIX domain-containing protein [Candidatus Nealsonbacteria bacterium]|nr:NUDIX domain-containing protein [Candidatus Nealsonbacteria bacterium]